jgi:hypothetical protein
MTTTATRAAFAAALLIPALGGCDQTPTKADDSPALQAPHVAANVQAEPASPATALTEMQIDPTMLDLRAAAELVEQGEIATAEDLEVALNDPTRALSKVDIDVDGKVDPLHVVEVRDETTAERKLEIRAVPTSKLDAGYEVRVAELAFAPVEADGEVEFQARYSGGPDAEDEVAHRRRVKATFGDHVVVDVSVPLVGWLYIRGRPMFYGVWVHEHRGVKIPPGHLKHGHWKAQGHDDHHGVATTIEVRGGHDRKHRGKAKHKHKRKGKHK